MLGGSADWEETNPTGVKRSAAPERDLAYLQISVQHNARHASAHYDHVTGRQVSLASNSIPKKGKGGEDTCPPFGHAPTVGVDE